MPTTEASGGDDALYKAEAERIRRLTGPLAQTLVLVSIFGTDAVPPFGARRIPATGTGVLTRIGGRDFVLTAGHNLEDDPAVALHFPREDGLSVISEANRAIQRRWWRAESPDAGVLELDPADAVL